MKLILIGIQGSGKGTQAKLLSERFKIPHLSVGEILREEVARKTHLGEKISSIIDKGELVPDDLTVGIVETEIQGKVGFILDGFPRNLNQARKLDEFVKIDHVIHITLTDEEARRRIGGRLECTKCGMIYSLNFYKKDSCEKCGGALKRRDDDNDAAVEKRIRTFHESTKPLIEFYRQKGILREIDGAQPIEKVLSDIEKALR